MKQSPSENFIFTPRIYKPKENDFVIGIVIVRTPDLFVVDINSTETAILPTKSFDRGCLPTRDAMNRLNVVYARVACADSWTQTELSCQTYDYSQKKATFGLVEFGNILRCSLGFCHKLQQSPLIGHFSRLVSGFRIRITRNGFVWYTAETTNSMIAVKNVIFKHEFEDNIDHLIDFYQILISKLEQQDDSLMKSNPM
jgi:exosome complex component RRP40